MNRASTASILTITGITIIGGIVAYAAYFDYKRRNDPSFRKKIRTQKKKVEKVVAETKEKETSQALDVPPELLVAIHEKSNEEPLPTNPEERHQFFVGVVATAERLAAEGPHNFLEAAVYFYQALRVYPSPMELIVIYQKTVPEACLNLVMELYNMDVVGRIQGYFKQFPPKAMNVSIKKLDPNGTKGGQTRTHTLITSRAFKAGDVIYKESPVVATLDADIQERGTHCSHCLREVSKDTAIVPESDRLGSIYCSEKCQKQCGTQSQDLLFGDKSPLPAEVAIDLPQAALADRPKTQDAFAEYWRKNGSSGHLLVARLVSMQIIAELAKALPQAEYMKDQLPEISISNSYTLYDHIERMRFVDVPLPEDEYVTLKNLLTATLPFLEDAHSDERHAMFRGKIAYNAIGIQYGEGRDDKAALGATSERTRTPYGTSKQIGSGLFLVSSYMGHSCAPSSRPEFKDGTSEMQLIALKDLEVGEELTMAYTNVTRGAAETPAEAYTRRQNELAQGWKFTCICSRCVEEKESLGLNINVGEGVMTDGSKIEIAVPKGLP